MLVDRGFGADLLTMFTVDYEPGGAAQPHDHPFEEAYFFLAGEVEAELDGAAVHAPGRATSCSPASAASTASTTTGTGRVRWIETQAPQPPARHAYRWLADLEAVRARDETMIDGDGRSRRRRRDAGDRPRDRQALRRGRARGRPHRPDPRTRRRRGRRRGRRQTSAGVDVRPRRAALHRRRPSPTSGRCGTWRSSPSTATRTRSPTTTSTRRIRLVTLKLVGYTAVVQRAARPARPTTRRSCCSAGWPRSGRTRARRRSRRSTAASSA